MRLERADFRLAVALAAALAATSPAMAATRPSAGDRLRGEALAQRYCARCHAVGLSGASPNEGSPPFRSLGSRFPVADLINAIGQGAPTGHPIMPRFHLEFSEVEDLTAYVMSVQRPQD